MDSSTTNSDSDSSGADDQRWKNVQIMPTKVFIPYLSFESSIKKATSSSVSQQTVSEYSMNAADSVAQSPMAVGEGPATFINAIDHRVSSDDFLSIQRHPLPKDERIVEHRHAINPTTASGSLDAGSPSTTSQSSSVPRQTVSEYSMNAAKSVAQSPKAVGEDRTFDPEYHVMVKGFHKSMNVHDLIAAFQKFSDAYGGSYLLGKKGRVRNVFIWYHSEEEALRGIKKMNGRLIKNYYIECGRGLQWG